MLFANTEYVFSTADPSCGAQQLWSTTRPEKAWELPCGSRRAQTTCWPCWKLTGCSKLLNSFPSNAESSCRSVFYFRFTFQNSIFQRSYLKPNSRTQLTKKNIFSNTSSDAKSCSSFLAQWGNCFFCRFSMLWASQMKFHPPPLWSGGSRNLDSYLKSDKWENMLVFGWTFNIHFFSLIGW